MVGKKGKGSAVAQGYGKTGWGCGKTVLRGKKLFVKSNFTPHTISKKLSQELLYIRKIQYFIYCKIYFCFMKSSLLIFFDSN
jgi:hypothetical protein